MRTSLTWLSVGTGLCCALVVGRAGDYALQPVPFTDVAVHDAFWSPRIETNRVVTLPYAFEQCEKTGRLDNFAKAGGLKSGKFRGIFFNDSDVYKIIEGAAYALAQHPDPKFEAYVDGVIDLIAAAQEPDGYLYTARTLCGPDYMPPGGKERWSNTKDGHELYNVGHLYEAAVAYANATGKRKLLDVAQKNADLICQVFSPGKLEYPSGHEEIEIGLVKLYRETGDEKYLRQAKFFLDARGRPEGHRLYGEYAQDHKPVVEQEEAVGHAVRAAYLYTGMADVAALTGQPAYVKAIRRIWEDVVNRKLYVTGGIGAAGGNEGFGAEWFLPNRTAYCETCASVANAMWNHRMFLWTGDGRFMDVVERVIYNSFLSGISMNGDRFFYPNRLESFRGERRQPWFSCACCPANIVRFVPSIPGYAYAVRGREVFVSLFLGGDTRVKVDGVEVGLHQDTGYPWEGRVRVRVAPATPLRFALRVRIPGWAGEHPLPGTLYHFAQPRPWLPELRVNGRRMALDVELGYARIERRWASGDEVELRLPMPVRRVLASPKIAADRGRVALQRGPLMFCLEGVDQPAGRVLSLVLPDDARLWTHFEPGPLGGVQVITGEARVARRDAHARVQLDAAQPFKAIPYYAWAHREPCAMTVWPAREAAAARPLAGPSLARDSRVKVSHGSGVEALTDQLEPASSIDHDSPYFHWWPRKGTREWVEFTFPRPTRVSAVEVYWFDDTGMGACRVPAAWEVKVRVDDTWRPVEAPTGAGVARDRFNRCQFRPVQATGLRLEVQSQEHWAGGIHEVKIE